MGTSEWFSPRPLGGRHTLMLMLGLVTDNRTHLTHVEVDIPMRMHSLARDAVGWYLVMLAG